MDDFATRLAAFAAPFSPERPLFSLHFADSSLDSLLLPLAASGDEQLSQPFRIVVDCLSCDAALELKQLLGLGIDLVIPLNEGNERRLAGLVTQAEQRGSDGGFANYRLVVEPALALLRLRRNSRVFQERSVVDIVALLLDEQIGSNAVFAQHFRHRSELTQRYPARSFCQQYRENDLTFIERLLREEGISYRFECEHDGDAVGLHTLVLFDAGSTAPTALQPRVRFHRANATEHDDTLTQWSSDRRISSGRSALASFDYKGADLMQAEEQSLIDHGNDGRALTDSLEDYDPQTLYYASGRDEHQRYATLRQQAHDLRTKQFIGDGVVRGLAVGHQFALDDHPIHDHDEEYDRQFIVLHQQFSVRNNFPGEFSASDTPFSADALPARTEAGFRNRIEVARVSVPIVPEYQRTNHAKPTAFGIQTATVVGPAGEEIFTDELGRIKVQFHWARAQDHDITRHGASAEKNDFSSCWIRVGYPSAGNGFGHQFIPRIGQEVAVGFIENDIDRPIVTGVIHNGQQTPPTFNGAGALPANKTLSGIKSREHKGHRHNELLFDDTPNEIRAQLSSEHGKSQLNLGFLIHPRRNGKGEPRGNGFELRSDHAGAIRAAQGLLLTTEAQRDADGQLARTALLKTLDAATTQADQLGEFAKRQNANQAESGKHHQAIDSGEGSQLGQQPLLLLNGQHGLTAATPQSMAISCDSNLDQIAQRDTRQTTGRRWIGNAVESISLFVAGTGNTLKESLKLIAAKGDIQMQAQSGDIEIDGDQSLTLTACKQSIIARAEKEIVLHCAGAQITLSGGDIVISAPGNLSLKGAQQLATGPVNVDTPLPTFDDQSFAGKHRLVRPTDGEPIKDQPYRITLRDGSTIEGITSASGETELMSSKAMELFEIEFFDKPHQ